jgi:hypothetical protein
MKTKELTQKQQGTESLFLEGLGGIITGVLSTLAQSILSTLIGAIAAVDENNNPSKILPAVANRSQVGDILFTVEQDGNGSYRTWATNTNETEWVCLSVSNIGDIPGNCMALAPLNYAELLFPDSNAVSAFPANYVVSRIINNVISIPFNSLTTTQSATIAGYTIFFNPDTQCLTVSSINPVGRLLQVSIQANNGIQYLNFPDFAFENYGDNIYYAFDQSCILQDGFSYSGSVTFSLSENADLAKALKTNSMPITPAKRDYINQAREQNRKMKKARA